jgi:2-polyprenyl-3-methyl-5-hydroxy-6-metoxy-1,4-benzoquinol methylase
LIKVESNSLEVLKTCPFCHSTQFREVGKLPQCVFTSYYTVLYPIQMSVAECLNCFLKFKNPVCGSQLDLDIYQRYVRKSKRRWVGGSYPKDILGLLKAYDDTTNFLEVGPGETPVSSQIAGGNHYTLDIDSSHIIGSSHRSIEGSIDQALDSRFESFFDVIVMFDIAEHVKNLDIMFENLYKILKPGGEVIIETGDADSFVAKRRKGEWNYFSIPEHRVFFSPQFVKKSASSYRFELKLLRRVRHKRIRRLSGIAIKLLAYAKWRALTSWRPHIRTEYDRAYFLAPDPIPWRDHIFFILRKN